MTREEHYNRLKKFGIRIIKLSNSLPHNVGAWAIAKQIVRSGTSPAANYRAACRGKSDKDFLNKLKMVEEELDETMYWLEMIVESDMLPENRLEDLRKENEELLRMTVSAINTIRKKMNS